MHIADKKGEEAITIKNEKKISMKSVDYQKIMAPTVREALCQINT